MGEKCVRLLRQVARRPATPQDKLRDIAKSLRDEDLYFASNYISIFREIIKSRMQFTEH